ncbi:uncharacterized protein LDX57_007687 [Aspergillus melleus]|uniref:uncharacterized protein n=1 Tax=Aspergillus melleus TaxID=138277 RepID=UPI001E8EC768|nr:uncharacterized protein LDX57_007687 [Aspergillus melleus]KAH8430016.1 hypothetical protein LDX57_007687 [Aspergillus melleus]
MAISAIFSDANASWTTAKVWIADYALSPCYLGQPPDVAGRGDLATGYEPGPTILTQGPKTSEVTIK